MLSHAEDEKLKPALRAHPTSREIRGEEELQ
jgi:hypothetical protein